jgi:hypothetical protein
VEESYKEEATMYEIVYPIGRSILVIKALAPHLPDLTGKTICGSGHSYEGDEAFGMIAGLLNKQYPGIKFIPNTEFPEGVSTEKEMEAFQDTLQKKGCDAVLSGIGC